MQGYERSKPKMHKWRDMSEEWEQEQESFEDVQEHGEAKGGALEQHRTTRQ